MKAALAPKPSEELYNLLKSTADILNSRPDLREEMRGTQGWINATIGFKTSDNKMGSAVIIKDGHVTVKDHIPEDVDACLIFRTEKDFTNFQTASKDDASLMILKGRMWIEGTIALYNYCDYLVNLVFLDESRTATKEIIREHQIEKLRIADGADTSGRDEKVRRRGYPFRRGTDPVHGFCLRPAETLEGRRDSHTGGDLRPVQFRELRRKDSAPRGPDLHGYEDCGSP